MLEFLSLSQSNPSVSPLQFDSFLRMRICSGSDMLKLLGRSQCAETCQLDWNLAAAAETDVLAEVSSFVAVYLQAGNHTRPFILEGC